MKCENIFSQLYHRDPVEVAFCPYRVCPIGAHVDHQHGLITGLAIDKGIHIAFRPKRSGIVELRSLQFPKRAQWHIHSVPEKKENDWADYLRGATIELSKKYSLEVGLCGVIEGTLPIGGLSSSAAFEVMITNPAIKNLIREGKTYQIQSMIQTNKKIGMQTMDDAIYDLYVNRYIDKNHALGYAQDAIALSKRMF